MSDYADALNEMLRRARAERERRERAMRNCKSCGKQYRLYKEGELHRCWPCHRDVAEDCEPDDPRSNADGWHSGRAYTMSGRWSG